MGALLTGAKALTLAQKLMVVGTGIGVAGQIQAGRVAQAEAKSAQNIANYNAALQKREAEAFEAKTIFEQERFVELGEEKESAAIAEEGRAGRIGAPITLKTAAKRAEERELEMLLLGYEGEVLAQRAKSQAELDRLQGKLYKQKGRNLQTASYFKAGSSLLTGFGEAFV